tara:strand:- start:11036 stop:11422 length:387 start_codon:yes stop_codon:yes gene_type:complete
MNKIVQDDYEDKILMTGLEFYGIHGVLDDEKSTSQKFIIDICLYQDLALPGRTDDLKLTTDYSSVYKVIKNVVENNSFNLIEALGNEIANKIISNFMIQKVMVTVEKPNAPIEGANFSTIAIQITRKR